MSTKTDRELLAIYDSLPSLLDLATEQTKSSGGNPYKIQDELQAQFITAGKVFRHSMLYRSLFECFQCRYTNTQTQHLLVNPGMKEIDPGLHTVGVREEDIHQIREHDAAFSAECRKFLERVADENGGL